MMAEAAFAFWCFVVALGGGIVGLVLGNLRLPATLLIATTPGAATGANLFISAVAALVAGGAHVRAGRVNWKLVAVMGPPSVAGALFGGYVSGALPADVLLVFIAVVLVQAGISLLRPPSGPPPPPPPKPRLVPAAVLGLGIGVLGGVVGLILGSLRMPALLNQVGEVAHRAVGTNLVVGVLVGIAGALGHLPTEAPDWRIAAIGAAASVPGALLGARLTGRLSDAELKRAIGAVLLLAAAGCVVQALA